MAPTSMDLPLLIRRQEMACKTPSASIPSHSRTMVLSWSRDLVLTRCLYTSLSRGALLYRLSLHCLHRSCALAVLSSLRLFLLLNSCKIAVTRIVHGQSFQVFHRARLAVANARLVKRSSGAFGSENCLQRQPLPDALSAGARAKVIWHTGTIPARSRSWRPALVLFHHLA